MTGIALFTHRRFGEELLRAAEGIVGQQERLTVLSVSTRDSLSSMRDMLRDSLRQLDDGSGILMLTDMLGGSSSNACLGLVQEFRMEVLTGVSLPMLLSALINRPRMVLEELAAKVLADGQKATINAKEMFMKKLKQRNS